eukprot:TRINITY_DN54608_c0_g1_i1.p1 TRINITY_DN54608_c0_g1~~TRINITY_DN54608_c0_g1_i1.p1  ORF type:complete len:411 (-),score=47.71 TRINITY_DN54608_c0_g1_i1:55-1287(-)
MNHMVDMLSKLRSRRMHIILLGLSTLLMSYMYFPSYTSGVTRRLSTETFPSTLDLRVNNEKRGVFGGRTLPEVLGHCPSMPPSVDRPTSIRKLHPGDVRVVAAIGDSITAAFASVDGIPVEFRGLSATIGGAPDRVTLPNLLKHYIGDEKLQGPATSWTDPLLDAADIFHHEPLLPVNQAAGHLNAAISNGVANDGPRQVMYISEVMAQYEKAGLLSLQQDWKLIVILLGANDLLGHCKGSDTPSQVVPKFQAAMNGTIAMLHETFPRTFVALLAVPDVSELGKFKQATLLCSLMHHTFEKSDFCPIGAQTIALHTAMNTALEELQSYWTDRVRSDDFAVVYQPFSQKMNLPNTSYLSKLDCFHPGEHGHAEAAVSLWNSLLTPRADKMKHNTVNAPMICANATSLLHID